jgi:hypothetical protein
VSFTPRPLYPQEISPRYPLDRRLGGPQRRSGSCEEKNCCPCRDSNTGRQPVAIPTPPQIQEHNQIARHYNTNDALKPDAYSVSLPGPLRTQYARIAPGTGPTHKSAFRKSRSHVTSGAWSRLEFRSRLFSLRLDAMQQNCGTRLLHYGSEL